jgi:hypothetical protein
MSSYGQINKDLFGETLHIRGRILVDRKCNIKCNNLHVKDIKYNNLNGNDIECNNI